MLGTSIFVGRGVAAIEMSQAQVEDLRLDRFGAGGVDGLAQLLDQQLDELGASALEVLSECLRA